RSSGGYLLDEPPDMTPSFPRTGVSGHAGAVQFISDLRCCTRTWYRYIQGPSGPRIPRPPVPNIDDPINLRPLSPGQVNKVWLWQSLPGPWIGSARNTVYLTGFEFLEP
ncbi:hypothetical protein, partial [Mycobacterium tuberculosis]